MAFKVTGEPCYFDTIANAYRILWDHHLFATGGYGPGERFQPDDGSQSKTLDALDWGHFQGASAETTCGSWAGFKLARYLMHFTGCAFYGDWTERLLYNAIGASLPMTGRGQTYYYSNYMMRFATKSHHPVRWPCCSGTYPIAVADYHNIIYYQDDDGLYVNLYLPSSVSWDKDDTNVKLTQETAFPESEGSAIRVETAEPVAFKLRFRVPGWISGALALSVNGQPAPVSAEPGEWAELARTWHDGDRVEVGLPMALRFVPVDRHHPRRAALMYGPVVLVADAGPTLRGDVDDPAAWIEPADTPLTFFAGERMFRPYYALDGGVPYWMYLDLTKEAE
jgi:DUF1680 family protein